MPRTTVFSMLIIIGCGIMPLIAADHTGTRGISDGSNITRFLADDSTGCVVINEINYNSAENFNPEDWLEFFNNSDSLIDISGWIFKDSEDIHHFVFPLGTTLEPGEYIVICRDTSLFKVCFPEVENMLGNFLFGLSGGGELLRLYDQWATLIDSLTYNDAGSWPPEPNGFGPTLELIAPDLPNYLAENWRSSVAPHGTPGSLNGVSTSVGASAQSAPEDFALYAPYPNPFNPSTVLRFELRDAGFVKLDVFDITGRSVGVQNFEPLHQWMSAGSHSVVFDGTDLASGIYFVRLTAGDNVSVRKLILMK